MSFGPTDWGPFVPTEYNVGAPATSLHFERWFRNVVAAAQGVVGSPYESTAWHPHNGTAVGDGATGRLWSFASDGSVSLITTPDFLDGFEYRLVFAGVQTLGLPGGSSLGFNLFRETSVNYAGHIDHPISLNTGDFLDGTAEILRPRIVSTTHLLSGNLLGSVASNLVFDSSTVVSGGARHATRQKILRCQISLTPGNFTAGAIFMHKRRVYA